MGKSLRFKFVACAMAALMCAMVLVCVAINAGQYAMATMRTDFIIQMLYENDGEFPEPAEMETPPFAGFTMTGETPFETRYFVVELDAEGSAIAVDVDHIAAVSAAEAEDRACRLVDSGKEAGFDEAYRFHVFDNTEGGHTVIVLDCFLQMQASMRLLAVTLVVVAASAIIALAVLIPLSKRAIRPFERNLARQQRFVTDASHELKTPIAIVSANIDLIEAIAGDAEEGRCAREGSAARGRRLAESSSLSEELSPWIESSRTQINRMDSLVKGMVELARADEEAKVDREGAVPASAAVERIAREFSALAEARGLSISVEADQGALVACSEDVLDRVLSLVFDNAVRYSDEGGSIRAFVRPRRKSVDFVVENPCSTLRKEDVSHMFERFWRADPSRSRETGGNGIGLATVRALAERCGGKAEASLAEGTVHITVTLPTAR